MNTKAFIVLLSVCALAITGFAVSEMGDTAFGNASNVHRISILDLQSIVARVLHPAGADVSGGGNGRATLNVLDLQRALAQAQQFGHPIGTFPAKPACKVCFFRHQSQAGWLLEPAERHAEPEDVASTSEPVRVFVRPARSILPTATERYLFRLTSNAPPCLA